MKTYVLIISKVFPSTHKRKGQETYFEDKIRFAFGGWNLSKGENGCKIHTIRANYPLWDKRIKDILDGNAILSLRYWSGKPYKSKQVEFAKINKYSMVGIQKLEFYANNINCPYAFEDNGISNHAVYGIEEIAANDGLSFGDFKEWFKKYNLSKPMAIIHFTNFRY